MFRTYLKRMFLVGWKLLFLESCDFKCDKLVPNNAYVPIPLELFQYSTLVVIVYDILLDHIMHPIVCILLPLFSFQYCVKDFMIIKKICSQHFFIELGIITKSDL